MTAEKEIATLPTTLAEFKLWEQNDNYKYEWHDGELIKFTGMNKKQVYVYEYLIDLFYEKGCNKIGTLVAEYDVELSVIQMRRPDIAYLTKEQVKLTKQGEDVVPEFVIEIISSNDQIIKVRNKLSEYFKYGVKVVWLIYPDEREIEVYTSYKQVKICTENDVCSAAPVLPNFEIVVSELLN